MNIVIVGSGTAGWSTAAALSYYEDMNITIIESDSSETIGVGESTTPLIKTFHNNYKIFPNLDWLKNSKGTLKFTIEFENFLKSGQKKWSHPFYTNRIIDSELINNLSNLNNLALCEELFYTQKLRNEKFCELDDENSNLGAFHFDAELYSKELKNTALKRGVKIVNDHVKSINYENNITKNLVLNDNSKIYGDLFIDCTGFHKTIFKNFDLDFIQFNERLLNDTAIVIKLPYRDKSIQKINATLGYALKNGWVWHIPLEDCVSYGYVFSSNYTNETDAKNELIEYLNNRYSYSIKENVNYKKINFLSGCYKNNWVGNNIAIGLSSFFIEPIESTGIALFQLQIIELCKIIENNPKFIFNYQAKYNKEVFNKILSVKEFIEMHYILSNRNDSSYWKDASSIKPSLYQENLIKLYEKKDFAKIFNHSLDGIFGSFSWLLLMKGMDYKLK